MSNLVVIGAQWGDEGKGKIVDLLSGKVDAVVRFQGGNNAGHTVALPAVKNSACTSCLPASYADTSSA